MSNLNYSSCMDLPIKGYSLCGVVWYRTLRLKQTLFVTLFMPLPKNISVKLENYKSMYPCIYFACFHTVNKIHHICVLVVPILASVKVAPLLITTTLDLL